MGFPGSKGLSEPVGFGDVAGDASDGNEVLEIVALAGAAVDISEHLLEGLGVLRGEVVLEQLVEGGHWSGPAECAVGSVLIVEVDEPVIGGSSLPF